MKIMKKSVELFFMSFILFTSFMSSFGFLTPDIVH
jgi:hypothetical protein